MNKIFSILVLTLATIAANAQDDFNPTLPGEPNALYKVTVGISHSAAGSVSGGGSFATGKQLTISRSDANFSENNTVFYKFKCWTLNGEEYTPAAQKKSFNYTVGTDNVAFKAVYEEVDPDDVTSKVFLVAEPSDACTFNISNGKRYFEDNSVYIYYNPSSDAFKFDGWYEGDELITTERYFNYTVGKNDATITAHFTYEPVIPGDPSGGGQSDIDNTLLGDANGDGEVKLADAILVLQYVLYNGDETKLSKPINKTNADVNQDGEIKLNDAIAIMKKTI